MAGVKPEAVEHVSHELGMHTEALRGRTQQRFFDVSEMAEGGFGYPDAPDVDFNKRAEFDAAPCRRATSICRSAT
jgi:methylamine---glutamate N-methyltransferase subunit B